MRRSSAGAACGLLPLALLLLVAGAAQARDLMQKGTPAPGGDEGGLIVGGTEAPQGRYPYMVNIASSDGFVYCGGSLIAPDVVMCAAHCSGADKVFIGRWDLDSNSEQYEEFDVAEEVKHPQYDDSTLENDFMLIKLAGSSSISPVQIDDGSGMGLPVNSDPNKNLNVMGWGTTSSGGSSPPRLMEVSVKYIPNNVCNNKYGSGSITDAMMCAASPGKDSCQGDSGGPLIVRGGDAGADVQVGVVSWGYGCADPDYPGVYARISSVRPWIVSTMDGWGSQLPGDGNPPPSNPPPSNPPPSAAFPPAPTESDKCCSELDFVNGDNDDVCADSEWPGQGCVSSATYQEALDICTAAGARLCSFEEVKAQETRGSGCGHDNRNIWTATSCNNGNGIYVGLGRDGSRKTCVTDNTALMAVRCCADTTACGPPGITCEGSDRLELVTVSDTQIKGNCASAPAVSKTCDKESFQLRHTGSGTNWSCAE